MWCIKKISEILNRETGVESTIVNCPEVRYNFQLVREFWAKNLYSPDKTPCAVFPFPKMNRTENERVVLHAYMKSYTTNTQPPSLNLD